MIRKFINRENEIKKLEEIWKKENSNVVIVYGRRRVGKSFLLLKFLEDKKGIYFLASDRSIEFNLRKLSERICNYFNVPITYYDNIQKIFDFVFSQIKDEKFVFIVDELGYLIRKDPGILSDLQEIIDLKLTKYKLKLILCSSVISMIETKVLGYKSPIYGRSAYNLRIQPFSIFHLEDWFPKFGIEERIKVYAVTNGVARYLDFFKNKNVESEIINNFFEPTSFLFRDAVELLKEELREIANYVQILEALSLGYNKINEIANYSFIEPKDVFSYLRVLSSMGIVERTIPLFSTRKEKRGIYEVKDFYFNFWFRFVSPFQSDIEVGMSGPAIQNFKKQFNTFLGHVYEKISKSFLIELGKIKDFSFTKIGKWWHKDKEIDLIALNEKTKEIGFLEVKWKDLSYNNCVKLLNELKEKASYVNWCGRSRKEYYGVIAKRIEGKEKLREEFVVYDLKDFETLFV